MTNLELDWRAALAAGRGGSVMTATHVNHQGTGRRRAIGPLGTTARSWSVACWWAA
jgi:hypothetical protein